MVGREVGYKSCGPVHCQHQSLSIPQRINTTPSINMFALATFSLFIAAASASGIVPAPVVAAAPAIAPVAVPAPIVTARSYQAIHRNYNTFAAAPLAYSAPVAYSAPAALAAAPLAAAPLAYSAAGPVAYASPVGPALSPYAAAYAAGVPALAPAAYPGAPFVFKK